MSGMGWLGLASGVLALGLSAGAARAAGGCRIPDRLPPGWTAGSLQNWEPPHRDAGVRAPAGSDLPSGTEVKVFRDRPAAYRYGADVVGKLERLPAHDAPGLSAWAADDGKIVLADGPANGFSVVATCVLRSSRSFGAPPRCTAVSTRLPGVFVSVAYPSTRLKQSMDLVAAAEAAVRTGLGCTAP